MNSRLHIIHEHYHAVFMIIMLQLSKIIRGGGGGFPKSTKKKLCLEIFLSEISDGNLHTNFDIRTIYNTKQIKDFYTIFKDCSCCTVFSNAIEYWENITLI